MSDASKETFVEDAVSVLVQHFGAERVRDALARVSKVSDSARLKSAAEPSNGSDRQPAHPSIAKSLETIRESDAAKHRLLSELHGLLKDRTILPESQDIRHFAQLIG